jgi:hypothetical protein
MNFCIYIIRLRESISRQTDNLGYEISHGKNVSRVIFILSTSIKLMP